MLLKIGKRTLLLWLLLATPALFCLDRKAIFQADLGPYGYSKEERTKSGQWIADYTDLSFLSDSLLLVSVNQRIFHGIDPMFSDSPASELLIFDIDRKELLRHSAIAVEKSPGSVKPTASTDFLVLSNTGLRLCSVDFLCQTPVPTKGPVFISPDGRTVIAGGNVRTNQVLLDSRTLSKVKDLPVGLAERYLPGDGGLLLAHPFKLSLELPGQTEKEMPLVAGGIRPEALLLPAMLVGMREDRGSKWYVAVSDFSGQILWSVPADRSDRVGLAASRDGARLLIHESGYTNLNSIVNFLDIDEGRPHNYQRARVVDAKTGGTLFDIEWDPRPHVVRSSLSPGGHRLAIVHKGVLEVYEVP